MIKPMLAHKFNPDKAVFPALLQPKLDGVRCVFTKEGAFSRTGKEFKNVDHIIKTLKPLFKKYPYIRLDGELYNHKLKDDFETRVNLIFIHFSIILIILRIATATKKMSKIYLIIFLQI